MNMILAIQSSTPRPSPVTLTRNKDIHCSVTRTGSFRLSDSDTNISSDKYDTVIDNFHMPDVSAFYFMYKSMLIQRIQMYENELFNYIEVLRDIMRNVILVYILIN